MVETAAGMRGIVVVWAHLIVDAGFGELGGIFALIPGLYQGLGVLWNGQVQAMQNPESYYAVPRCEGRLWEDWQQSGRSANVSPH